jgi:plasmid stabilization system protein ParE
VSGYKLSSQAAADLRNIWGFLAVDNIDAADRVLGELRKQFTKLTETPGLGHRRNRDGAARGPERWRDLADQLFGR